MKPSLKPKSLVSYVRAFLPYYKAKEFEVFEDSKTNDVYVAPIDDPISSSSDEFAK